MSIERNFKMRDPKQRVIPQFRMTEWTTSRRFYESGLGFTVEWEHTFEPGFPVFAELQLDGVSLFLTEHVEDCEVGGAAYFLVPDVDELFQKLRANGVEVKGEPENTPWNVREMLIVDPDGNRLRFAGPVK